MLDGAYIINCYANGVSTVYSAEYTGNNALSCNSKHSVTSLEVYTSLDGSSYTLRHSGALVADKSIQFIAFDEPTLAQYVKYKWTGCNTISCRFEEVFLSGTCDTPSPTTPVCADLLRGTSDLTIHSVGCVVENNMDIDYVIDDDDSPTSLSWSLQDGYGCGFTFADKWGIFELNGGSQFVGSLLLQTGYQANEVAFLGDARYEFTKGYYSWTNEDPANDNWSAEVFINLQAIQHADHGGGVIGTHFYEIPAPGAGAMMQYIKIRETATANAGLGYLHEIRVQKACT